MKTLIINGSPKGIKANSERFISSFTKPLNSDSYDTLRLQHEYLKYDINKLNNYDSIIMVMPLYIHAMPGMVMKFFERLTPFNKSIKIGFIIQFGFPEQYQAEYLVKLLENMCIRLNLDYIGCVLRGDAAGMQFVPKKYKTLFNQLEDLGAIYKGKGAFDKDLCKRIGESGEIRGIKKVLIKLVSTTGLDDLMMKNFFSSKEAYKQRFQKMI